MKRFEWIEKWAAERGEDRGIRRLMEKENKKKRDEYKKEYNETVRVSYAGVDVIVKEAHEIAIGPLPATSRSAIQSTSGPSRSEQKLTRERYVDTECASADRSRY
jgi:hypothetical protein